MRYLRPIAAHFSDSGAEFYVENVGIAGDLLLKLHTLVYSIHSGAGVLFLTES